MLFNLIMFLKGVFDTFINYLKSPESSDRELFVEVSKSRQVVDITEVEMRVGTEQAAHLSPDKLVLQQTDTFLSSTHVT